MPFLPALAGDYPGSCAGKPAALRVQTPVGLGVEVSGLLGMQEGESPNFRLARGFGEGSYHPFLFDAQALALGATHCKVSAKGLSCGGPEGECVFSRPEAPPSKLRFARRLLHLTRTADEKKPLPAQPTPEELQGTYTGFFHHEALDAYAPVGSPSMLTGCPTGRCRPGARLRSTSARIG